MQTSEGGHWVRADGGMAAPPASGGMDMAPPTALDLMVHESKGASAGKTYVKFKYAGQSSRTGAKKLTGDTATYQQVQNFTIDAEVLEIKLMEEKLGADAELAQGAILITTIRPNEWTGWVKLESLNKKATAPAVRLSYTVK